MLPVCEASLWMCQQPHQFNSRLQLSTTIQPATRLPRPVTRGSAGRRDPREIFSPSRAENRPLSFHVFFRLGLYFSRWATASYTPKKSYVAVVEPWRQPTTASGHQRLGTKCKPTAVYAHARWHIFLAWKTHHSISGHDRIFTKSHKLVSD